MEELKKKVESVLFSSGRKMHINEISRLVGNIDVEAVKKALLQLKEKYNDDSSLMLVQEGEEWKLTVKERYTSIVHKLVMKTELTKTLMETLAVIAYKAPVLQSDIIKIRTNKAYDHLKELEESGYIFRSKHGRTKMIKLTPKFFEYFDIPPDKLKEKFKTVHQLEKAVEEKEQELMEKKAEIRQKKEDIKEKDVAHRKKTAEETEKLDQEIEDIKQSTEIDIIDAKGKKHELKQYASEKIEGTALEGPEETMPPYKEKIGQLEVYEPGMSPKEKEEFVEEAEKERDIEEKEEAEEEGAEEPAEEAGKEGAEGGEEVEGAESAEEEPSEEEAPEEEAGEEEGAEEPEEGPSEEIEEKARLKKAEKPKRFGTLESSEEAEEVHKETIEEYARRIAEAKMAGKPIDFKGEKLFAKGVPPEVQKQIDARVEEMIHGKKKEGKKDKATGKEESEGESEEKSEEAEESKEEKPEEETGGLPY